MKEKIKTFLQQNWFKIGLLITLVAIAGGAFYWFQWRPTQIRKECNIYANSGEVLKQDKNEPLSLNQYLAIQSMYDDSYNKCLHEHGLEK